ncbi:MAG TPA: hypothetical protein VKA46_39955 [Gemmataceae bacterium]|nr:hypothetical protein [Gemmataceae bacterium]
MSELRPLHRLFALSWIDFFQGTAVRVETEMDLSLKQQFLDIVLIRKGPEPIPWRLPDGFEDLGAHNLLTFKSFQEALDGWSLLELVGHYVNYRKQSSPSFGNLLPESDYRLYAVCVRFPHNLAQQVPLTSVRPGVYELRVVTVVIRIIVASQLPQEEQNALLHLFTSRDELVRYGQAHYQPHSTEMSTVLLQLFKTYREDPDMPDTLKEFARKTIKELLASMPPEERMEGISLEERMEGISLEKRMEGIPGKERAKGLSADDLAESVPIETLEAALKKLKPNGSPPKP